MNTAPAGKHPVRWLIGLTLLIALGVFVWWLLLPATVASPVISPPPVTRPAPALEVTPDPATAAALTAWRTALNADQWQEANHLEDTILARGDAAVPNLEAEFEVAPEAADLAVTIVRLDRLAALLGRLNSPAAVAALNRLLNRVPQPEVRGQILLALAQTADRFEDQVVPALIQALQNRSEPDSTRSSVAILLARRRPAASRQQLVAWAQTPPAADPVLGDWALTALAYARDAAGAPAPDAWQTLTAVLQADPAPARRRTAAVALGLCLQPAAAEPLIAALQDADLAVRRAVVESLAGLPPAPDIDTALARVVESGEDAGLRALAATGLGRAGATANLPPLQAALQPATPVYVQLKLVAAMETIGGAAALQQLRAVAQSSLPVTVKSAAAAAADRLAAGAPASPPPDF